MCSLAAEIMESKPFHQFALMPLDIRQKVVNHFSISTNRTMLISHTVAVRFDCSLGSHFEAFVRQVPGATKSLSRSDMGNFLYALPTRVSFRLECNVSRITRRVSTYLYVRRAT